MKATIEVAADRRRLVVILFERQGLESDNPVIRVVYQIEYPDDFTEPTTPVLVGPISCTRTDTGESVTLSTEEKTEVLKVAASAARSDTPEW